VIRPVPAPGSAFFGWTVGGNPEAGCSQVLDNGDCVISSFKMDTILFTDIGLKLRMLNVRVSGGGTVTCNGAPCTNMAIQVPDGTMVNIVPSPAAGSIFYSFTEDCAGAQPTCSVTMDRNRSTTVNFGPPATLPTTPTAVPKLAPLRVWEYYRGFKSNLFKYENGKVEVEVRCYSNNPCRGNASLYGDLPNSRSGKKGKGHAKGKGHRKSKGHRSHHKLQRRASKAVLLDKVPFNVGTAEIPALVFKISNPRAKALLNDGKTLFATVRANGMDPTEIRIRK
jgi:hypothetical protein